MKASNEKTKIGKSDVVSLVILLVIGICFFFVFGERGYALYPDSYGYILPSYEREPLYPLLIMLCRGIFGERLYLYGVVYIQSLLALGVTVFTASYMKKQFRLNGLETVMAFLLLLIPYGLDTMWSEPRDNYTHMIMSDAVSYSLFYVYLLALMQYIRHKKWSAFSAMLLLASVMTWNRSQMEICYLITGAAVVVCHCRIEKRRLRVSFRKILARAAMIIGAAVITILMTYCYSCLMWGKFARSSENDFTTLTNLLYASDAEDEALFEDPDTAAAFRELYARVDEAGLTYRYAPDGFLSNGEYMLACHDPMKSGIIRPFFKEYIANLGRTESFESDQLKKALASEMKSVLLKEHFWEWLYNGICMAPRGFLYAVTPVIPPGTEKLAYAYTILFIILFLALYVYHIIQTKKLKDSQSEEKNERVQFELWIGCILLFIGINIAAVSVIILVIARYINYTQGLVYLMLYLIMRDIIKGRKHTKDFRNIRKPE